MGIEVAKGEFLAFIDADDTVEYNFIEKVMHYCTLYDFDVLWFNIRFVNEIGKELFISNNSLNLEITQKQFLRFFYGMNNFIGSLYSKIYKREFIENKGIRLNKEIVYGEDWDFNLRIGLNNPKVITIPDVLYNYVKFQNIKTVSTKYYRSDIDTFCNSHLRLSQIALEYDVSYDIDEQNSIFIYNCISLIQKLYKSNLSKKDKFQEFKRIINKSVFKEFLMTNKWDCRYMSFRQKIVSYLLKYKHCFLARLILSL